MRILYTNRKHDLLDNTAAKSVKHKNKHTSHTVLSVKRVSKHYYHCDKNIVQQRNITLYARIIQCLVCTFLAQDCY